MVFAHCTANAAFALALRQRSLLAWLIGEPPCALYASTHRPVTGPRYLVTWWHWLRSQTTAVIGALKKKKKNPEQIGYLSISGVVLLHTSVRLCIKATEQESVKHCNGLGTTGKHFFTSYVTMLKWWKFGLVTLQKSELWKVCNCSGEMHSNCQFCSLLPVRSKILFSCRNLYQEIKMLCLQIFLQSIIGLTASRFSQLRCRSL